jgi:enoyl-CoA hydratase/carnithine racemase
MAEETASDVLLEEVDQHGICVLTINRPQAMNSLDGELVSALWHSFYALNGRADVRVIILTAAGERAFCVGADLKERKSMSEAEVAARLRDYRGAFRAIENVDKPVICGINGYALGGGLELALGCDLRVAAAEAVVGLTEARLGVIPGAGGTQRLPRVVGLAKAKELVFTGAKLTAAEAEAIGLVNRVVPREELLPACRTLATEIAKAAPISLSQAKIAMSRGIEVDLETGLELEAQCYAATLATEDRLEGLAAFAEKRSPEWKGR